MSHPLRKYARAVQDEMQRAGWGMPYQAALAAVQRHWTTAHAAVPPDVTGKERRESVIVKIVETLTVEASR